MIHNYRWRFGLAQGEAQYDELEKRLAEAPVIARQVTALGTDDARFGFTREKRPTQRRWTYKRSLAKASAPVISSTISVVTSDCLACRASCRRLSSFLDTLLCANSIA